MYPQHLFFAVAVTIPLFAQAFVSIIESGGNFSCAVGTAADLSEVLGCWGSNEYDQLDVPEDIKPSQIGGSLSAGKNHVCYLTYPEVGHLYCWGGEGNKSSSIIPSHVQKVSRVAAGGYHTCVSQYDEIDYRKVHCWGDAEKGYSIDPPADLGTPLTLDASISGHHTCSIAHNPSINNNENRVVCWGCDENDSQVCDGIPSATNIPDFRFGVAVGLNHACFVIDEYRSSNNSSDDNRNVVECWGDNSYGQLEVPPDLVNVTGITSGDDFTCAIQSLGDLYSQETTVKCWGKNTNNQLDVPADLKDYFVSSLSAGSEHVCAIQEFEYGEESFTTPIAVCWGSNSDGQISPLPEIFVDTSSVRRCQYDWFIVIIAIASAALVL